MNIINVFDKTIIEFAHSLHNNYHILDLFFSLITNLGESIPLMVFTIILIFIKRTRICGINMAVSLFISILIGAIILKPLIARERPFTDPIYNEYWIAVGKHLETSFSCPSSHTTASFAVLFPVFLYFNKQYSFIAVLIALLIGFSRVYLVVHYPSDVVFGAFIGITVSSLTYFVFKKINIEYKLSQIKIINKFDNQ
ncbi:phosphatase PAP2 family protein [Brachyspira hyodysenteriae]|uniref:phosphatase PAP2 family protein n=1 Tax=Brachyspira hyodysenteriae TaxID=159 RepID=UPI00063DA31F|nr:phosphatase PAP2 family protein [Brachyspira hyodysenteriae]KLI32512.1 phosphatidic acid phosphatase [Brachyspira hyodysenteriae]MDA0034407.1 phosphatase PAP2 family protein [Brachyspira hyodysenteriae]MDA0048483.1 phosphatase PAP2 family protein [Brachyspira hyodysenteriae]MDA0062516.1 phosphatase PAP2 family protein [Brachyspira hyodysenteriae]MDA0066281.1 phosphatase PAP2 family protein [Brachyspira hyodysenteriae]